MVFQSEITFLLRYSILDAIENYQIQKREQNYKKNVFTFNGSKFDDSVKICHFLTELLS